MSVAKSLNEDQIAQIQSWADEGSDLSEIQRRLDADLSIKVTYMELRFLMEDLKIELKSEAPPEEPEEEEASPDETESGDSEASEGDEAPAEGEVTVTISELVRPGAMVSGRVTFANGKGAAWWMDQMGRLGMDGDDPAYKPSEADMLAFQQALQQTAKEKGY